MIFIGVLFIILFLFFLFSFKLYGLYLYNYQEFVAIYQNPNKNVTFKTERVSGVKFTINYLQFRIYLSSNYLHLHVTCILMFHVFMYIIYIFI